MNLKEITLPVLTTLVLATGAAAWNASASNDVQAEKIVQLEKRVDEVDRLADNVAVLSTNVAVLAERVKQLAEANRAR